MGQLSVVIGQWQIDLSQGELPIMISLLVAYVGIHLWRKLRELKRAKHYIALFYSERGSTLAHLGYVAQNLQETKLQLQDMEELDLDFGPSLLVLQQAKTLLRREAAWEELIALISEFGPTHDRYLVHSKPHWLDHIPENERLSKQVH